MLNLLYVDISTCFCENNFSKANNKLMRRVASFYFANLFNAWLNRRPLDVICISVFAFNLWLYVIFGEVHGENWPYVDI